MIQVTIPKEIMDYREKIIFGLSIRQLITLGISIIFGIGIGALLVVGFNISIQIASYPIMILVMPILALGFIRKNGLPLEQYIFLFFRHNFRQQIRPYVTEYAIDKENGGNIINVEENTSGEDQTDRNRNTKAPEAKIFKGTTASRTAARKAAYKQIKGAKKDYRAAKRRYKKAAHESSSTQNSTTNDSI